MRSATDDTRGDVWVFGYGSLVDPADFSSYVGHTAIEGLDWARASLVGYERDWLVGMQNMHADPDDKFYINADGTRYSGIILSLGVSPAEQMEVNGIVFRVGQRGIGALDTRERRYDRIDISGSTQADADLGGMPIHTYVARPDAWIRAERAIADGTAAIPRRYEAKVHAAFRHLGVTDAAAFAASTRVPRVPIADLDIVQPQH